MSKILNSTTTTFFTTEYNHSQSSRALGWNTNDPTVFDQGWNNSCGNLSAQTFMHLGFTGTEMCADPVNKIITILLTNRVYPNDSNTKIQLVRQLFNQAVMATLYPSKETNAEPVDVISSQNGQNLQKKPPS
eukprot:TRINITY_DN852_c0_g3_i1.p1 TRINITY_DN852_c0_g3~~TRINITY_DN852_c0_g3_i1.p1  ORF type:complete len:132 (-),score=5.66 TRINITY_DN852_c0_g3_i1:529-924(-)